MFSKLFQIRQLRVVPIEWVILRFARAGSVYTA